ncbi:acyltransferase (plasmid) [Skermanella rosea]|uniref:acyltransferase family protein n=1 Tax=Skermanella rosea TaxID=1817965 RepID=UPI0019344CB8|nr:acyltransferase [Skermanella rosea]UEM07341.1 acyltransferase [Skermanella rosea]
MRPTEGRFLSIQVARGIAALEVVYVHSFLVVKHVPDYQYARPFPDLIPEGIGVDLFFLISGFVMASVVTSPGLGPGNFLLRRFIRIYPIYWIFSAAVVLAFLLNPAWNLGSFSYSPTNIIKSLLLFPQLEYPLLSVGWTLEHEALFYLMVASMLAIGRPGAAPTVVLCFFFSGIVLRLVGEASGTKIWDFHVTSPMLAEFWLGMILYNFRNRVMSAGSLPVLVAVMAGCLAVRYVSASWAEEWGVWQEYYRVVTVGFFCFAFLGILMALEKFVERRSSFGVPAVTGLLAGLVILGDISYSLYLSHWFILSALGKAITIFPGSPAYGGLFQAGGIILCVILAAGTYFLLEKPMIESLNRHFRSRSRAGGRTWLGGSPGSYLRSVAQRRQATGSGARPTSGETAAPPWSGKLRLLKLLAGLQAGLPTGSVTEPAVQGRRSAGVSTTRPVDTPASLKKDL